MVFIVSAIVCCFVVNVVVIVIVIVIGIGFVFGSKMIGMFIVIVIGIVIGIVIVIGGLLQKQQYDLTSTKDKHVASGPDMMNLKPGGP